MYSSEYTSGFSGPAASYPAPLIQPRHEDNVGQAPANFEAITKNFSKPAAQSAGTSIAPYLAGCSKRLSSKAAASEEAKAYASVR
jgi:hypothetical protein